MDPIAVLYLFVVNLFGWTSWFFAGFAAVVISLWACHRYLKHPALRVLLIAVSAVLPALLLWRIGQDQKGEHGMVLPVTYAAAQLAVMSGLLGIIGWLFGLQSHRS
jgi:hypothetical protein